LPLDKHGASPRFKGCNGEVGPALCRRSCPAHLPYGSAGCRRTVLITPAAAQPREPSSCAFVCVCARVPQPCGPIVGPGARRTTFDPAPPRNFPAFMEQRARPAGSGRCARPPDEGRPAWDRGREGPAGKYYKPDTLHLHCALTNGTRPRGDGARAAKMRSGIHRKRSWRRARALTWFPEQTSAAAGWRAGGRTLFVAVFWTQKRRSFKVFVDVDAGRTCSCCSVLVQYTAAC